MARLTDEQIHAAALASLGAGPRRLRQFLEGVGPAEAWEALARGSHPADPDRVFRRKAVGSLVTSVAASCETSGVEVLVREGPGYPAGLAEDPEAPAVLFARGDAALCDRCPRVAVVGTRSATPYGMGVASEIGRGLANVGVVVVSGLARGIDTSAHRGALDSNRSSVFGVLGRAIDAALPRAQAELRDEVASDGSIVSEIPPGSAGSPAWWFIVRNRVIAAMAHVVVVVECHAQGGALHTVKAALKRGIPVAAVPGSVRSRASAGTNALLFDGATPVRDTSDVVALVELAIAGRPQIAPPRLRNAKVEGMPERSRAHLSPNASKVCGVLDADPSSLDTVVLRSGLPLGEVALALEELTDRKIAQNEAGWWRRIGG